MDFNGKKVIVLEAAVNTPFGEGVEPVWTALTRKLQARPEPSAPVESPEGSRVWDLLGPIADRIRGWECDHLFLATTKGETDALEGFARKARGHSPTRTSESASSLQPRFFLERMLARLAIPSGTFVSSACASSNLAVALAAEALIAKRTRRVAVLGVDIVSNFVVSGFSALGALSQSGTARPFDAARDGLTVGEACCAVALELGEPGRGLGTIEAWGSASDANHVTGPSREGAGLSAAFEKAFSMTESGPSDIGAVLAHGTGTIYNDAMEMKAFKRIFPSPLPVFSVKGSLGHTMGAAGVIETVLALEALRERNAPPTVGLETPDTDASGWASTEFQAIQAPGIVNANSGFGGINSVLVLSP